jgi:MFS family permease
LLIAAYDFAEILAKPVFGFIADRKGMKATMLVGIAIFSLASIAFPFIDPRWLLAIRFFQGLGAAALSIVSAALVADYFPESRGRAFGVYNAIKGAGYVLSPVIGGAIV